MLHRFSHSTWHQCAQIIFLIGTFSLHFLISSCFARLKNGQRRVASFNWNLIEAIAWRFATVARRRATTVTVKWSLPMDAGHCANAPFMAQRKSHRNKVHQFVVYYHVPWLIYTANVLEHTFKLKSQKRKELRYLKWFCRSTSLNKNHFEMSILLVDDFVFFDCRQLLDSYRCRKSTILCCANAQRKRAPIQSYAKFDLIFNTPPHKVFILHAPLPPLPWPSPLLLLPPPPPVTIPLNLWTLYCFRWNEFLHLYNHSIIVTVL